MSAISATIRLRSRSAAAAAEIRAGLVASVHDTGEKVVQRAKANLYPGHGYDTGELQGSIHYERDQPTGGTVKVDAPYAGYVELGTVHMAPIPYLRPAMAEAKTDLVEALNIRGRGGRWVAGLGVVEP
jgi:HK97 gp10 family phage protein